MINNCAICKHRKYCMRTSRYVLGYCYAFFELDNNEE